MKMTDEYRLLRIRVIGDQLSQIVDEEGITAATLLSNVKH